jgi:hypothetical protein
MRRHSTVEKCLSRISEKNPKRPLGLSILRAFLVQSASGNRDAGNVRWIAFSSAGINASHLVFVALASKDRCVRIGSLRFECGVEQLKTRRAAIGAIDMITGEICYCRRRVPAQADHVLRWGARTRRRNQLDGVSDGYAVE